MLAIAIQRRRGPTFTWHFVVVTDQARRRAIAELYRKSWANYLTSPTAATNLRFDDPTRDKVQQRVGDSAQYLADHLERAPVFLVPCFVGRIDGQPSSAQAGTWGSILPAVWSFMLAARARGLGTVLTTMCLRYEREVAAILGIPYEQFTQAALIRWPTARHGLQAAHREPWRASCTGTTGKPGRATRGTPSGVGAVAGR